ncbi:uncharacterized protein LOC133301776 [Gastrolobium bilobum]|uniref:uncharacterized protein LOC133301776 n=1 Tax=Gastrolobium bilobum TaxID=150636 RepID=UPI002AB1A058|nr:uncharacterized protein LOC133301776 [Gastrolobium bilobum]
MPRTRRFTARKSSTTSSTPPILETQNVQSNVAIQNVGQEDQVHSPSQEPADVPLEVQRVKRACNKYWVVEVIDDRGRKSEERLRIKDVLVLPEHKKVLVQWSEDGQPVGDGSSLLNGFLGHLACNTNLFPISYVRWPDVLPCYKTDVWENTIKKKFDLCTDDEHDYCMGNIGKKWKDNRHRCVDFIDKNKTFEENLENYPDGTTREQWAGFLTYKTSEKAQKYSEINTRNRAKQTIMHTLGAKSIAKTKHELVFP